MDDIFVARLMTSDVKTVTPDTLVEEAANRLIEDEIGSLVVTDGDDQVAGILTSTDFVHIVAESKPKAETTVQRYMTTTVITGDAQDSIADAAETMITYGIHHLPIVDDDGHLIGMLSTTDLAAYLSEDERPQRV
jgi:CBS domain-containing protein